VLFTTSTGDAAAQTCRQCDYEPPIPTCVLMDDGMNYCDDTEEGKCVLVGGTCGGFASLGAITETGLAAPVSQVTSTVVDGNLVIRSCDGAVVAQRMDREAQRAARQAASRIAI